VVIWDYYGGPGINIEPGASADNLGAGLFENIWILPGQNAIGLKIRSITSANEKFIQGLGFYNLMIENTGDQPAIDIESSSDGRIRGLRFRDLWIINPLPSTAVPVQIKGLWHSVFDGAVIATWAASGITIANSANKHSGQNIFMKIMDFGGTTNMINDAMTSYLSQPNVDIYDQKNFTYPNDETIRTTYFETADVEYARIKRFEYMGAIQTLQVNSTTPGVYWGSWFQTGNTVPTTITNFITAVTGERITVLVGDNNTTFDFSGTNLLGNSGADWAAKTGDMLEAVFDGSNWHCTVNKAS
jgi:hypothetical protein